MADPIPLYRGMANTWECDENGHLNVMFYALKATEGLQVLANHLGLKPSFLRDSGCILAVDEYYIRFVQELMPGASLYGVGGILNVSDHGFRAYVELRNGRDDTLSAPFQIAVTLRDARSRRPVPLGKNVRQAARNLLVDIPKSAQPRSVDVTRGSAMAGGAFTLADTEKRPFVEIMRGAVRRDECDDSGAIQPWRYIGRISDGVTNLARATSGKGNLLHRDPGRIGGAVVEYRMFLHESLRDGDVIIARSGITRVQDKANHLIHLIFNGETGALIASCQGVAITLDLKERKVIAIPADRREVLEGLLMADLSA